MKLMYCQCLDLLVEAGTFCDYNLSRLATSCLKHLLSSTVLLLVDSELSDCFSLAMHALERMISLNLQSVDILTRVYKVRSDHTYGNFADLRIRSRGNVSSPLTTTNPPKSATNFPLNTPEESLSDRSKMLDVCVRNISKQ
ncbi:hypothetical protein Ciccas_000754, partial [Cichlidogyrus casuarinus]